jgi:hypothetical protein
MAFLFDKFPRSIDAFGRYRVSNLETIFNSKQLANGQPLIWDDQQTTGAGTSSTYNTNQASTTMAVANVTAGTHVRQTFRSFNYQPGKSALINMTFVLGAGSAGITKRVGTFNANNGLFLQLSGAVLSVVSRSFTSGAAVDTVVAQSAWNLDKLNGLGPSAGNPSGITFDPTKIQLLVIDFQWLGTGQVRFGFYIGGNLIYVHQIESANVLSLVYMQIPNLPLRYEINNDGTGPVASLVTICGSVMSEGGQPDNGLVLATSRADTPLVTLNNNSIYPMIAIRLRSTHLFATVAMLTASVVCTSNATYRWMLLLNPAVVGTALAFVGVTNSAVEVDVTATNATTLTGGTQLDTGYGLSATAATSQIAAPSQLELGSTIAGVSDIIVFAIQRMTVGGAAETFFGSLGWRESR